MGIKTDKKHSHTEFISNKTWGVEHVLPVFDFQLDHFRFEGSKKKGCIFLFSFHSSYFSIHLNFPQKLPIGILAYISLK